MVREKTFTHWARDLFSAGTTPFSIAFSFVFVGTIIFLVP
jgi:hypothetical protein